MKEYSFDIRKNDPKLRWRGISPEYRQWVREHGIINLEGRDRSTLSKTNIHTKITLEDDKLRITVDRESEKFDRRLNSFSEGENEIYLSNISSIKFKVGYAIALNIHHLLLWL